MEENSRIIVIPDVHGRDFWKEAVRGHEKDNIVFLGDYVDRKILKFSMICSTITAAGHVLFHFFVTCHI